MARNNRSHRRHQPPPERDPRERPAMIGVLAGVALTTGVNLLTRDLLGLPYVGLFGTYFLAAFGGYFAWRMVLRRDFAPLGPSGNDIGLWCALVALLSGFAYTLSVGLLGLALDDGPLANTLVLPLIVIAFIVLRRWLKERYQR
jgi:hypothetical protein